MSAVLQGLAYAGAASGALLGVTAWGIWLERRMSARMQSRVGPVLVGPSGLFQPLADVLKLLQKEDIAPRDADRWLFRLAPVLTVLLALGVAAVVPFSPDAAAAQLDQGVVWVLAVGGLLVYPVWMAGWASNNKYSLLGAMRSVAQMVAYEVPLVMSALVPVVLAGSMSLARIGEAQAGGRWFALWPPGPGLVAFVLFVMGMLAESNRIPFDIPEAESELVGGVTTEYAGMSFGMFYLAEYLHTLIGSAVAAVLFLGGHDGPGPDGLHWLAAKTLLLFVGIYWLRWTLLRLRSDQLMRLCWVWLVPTSVAALVWAAVYAALGVG
ncbi:MAG TPA: NADH-quinone oxidoreductase subunit NuoH [Aggregicoccus sp.]|nr:NADH-quinone oxidoreductase subunit NuoH [Aggregicoccus sp.]